MSKVMVMSADQAKFRPYRWWSNWIDVAVLPHDGRLYLLQMSISKTNRKRFITTDITENRNYLPTTLEHLGDLVQMEIAKHAPENTAATTNATCALCKERLLDLHREQSE